MCVHEYMVGSPAIFIREVFISKHLSVLSGPSICVISVWEKGKLYWLYSFLRARFCQHLRLYEDLGMQ